MTKSVIISLEEHSDVETTWELWRDKIADALKKYAHDTYTIEDIEGYIADGMMLVWPLDKSIALLEVVEYPQKKCLHIFMVVGEVEDILYHMQFADDNAQFIGCDMISANGRIGWAKELKKKGWQQEGWFTKKIEARELN